MSAFNDEDTRLMMNAASTAVADDKTPNQHAWKNGATGHHGIVETLQSYSSAKGETCKRIRISNTAGSRTDRATYTVCNMPPDGWRLVPSDYAPAQKGKPQS